MRVMVDCMHDQRLVDVDVHDAAKGCIDALKTPRTRGFSVPPAQRWRVLGGLRPLPRP